MQDPLFAKADRLHFEAGLHGGKKRIVLTQILPHLSGKKTLDFGCSSGIYTKLFASVAQSVVGVDRLESSVDTAKEYNSDERVTYLHTSDIPDKDYDAIVFLDSLEYGEQWEHIFIQAVEVLNMDGVIFITCPNFNNKPPSFLQRFLTRLVLFIRYPFDMHVREASKQVSRLNTERGYHSVASTYNWQFVTELESYLSAHRDSLHYTKTTFNLTGRNPFERNHIFYRIEKKQ